MKKEIYLEFYEGECDMNEFVSWIVIVICIIASIALKHTILGLIGLFILWYRHITIIVKEKKK